MLSTIPDTVAPPASANDAAATARPRVAVLIPVYKAQEDLERTLATLDVQAPGFDIVVVDDGSAPPITLDAAAYRHRVILLRQAQNGGIEAALNAGLAHILDQGYSYVARQDAGDFDVGERVAIQAAYLDAHPEVAVVGAWVEFVDPQGVHLLMYCPPTTPKAIRQRLKYRPCFIHPATMIRASALREVGFYAFGYPCAEDYELFMRLARHYPCVNLDTVLVRKEDNPASLSNAKRAKSLRSRLKVQWRHFDWRSFDSYLGIAYSFVLRLVPMGAMNAVKRRLGTIR